MPCRCDEFETPAQYKQEADKLAAMLCSLCEHLERGEKEIEQSDYRVDESNPCAINTWPASVRKWWKDHKRKDEERKAKEAAEERKRELRASALAKLSKEERAVLGLK
jgi:hypothetical protein